MHSWEGRGAIFDTQYKFVYLQTHILHLFIRENDKYFNYIYLLVIFN